MARPTILTVDDDPQVSAALTRDLKRRYGYLESILDRQPFLLGDRFGVADAYLFTVTNWARRLKLDLAEFPALTAFQQRVAERPAVQAAMREEGLTD